jgi:hypothetical protein
MPFGCVYQVTEETATSEYKVDQIVVLECVTPCVEFVVPAGVNAGCKLTPLAEECMEYPPE